MSTPLERFPSPEDWQAIQGGKPDILSSPDMSGVFLVIHDYGYGTATSQPLEQAGMIVPTPRIQMLASVAAPLEVAYYRGKEVRDVRLPAVLYAKHHGLACNQKSFEATKGDQYELLGKRTVEDIAQAKGFIALKLSVMPNGQQFLKPLQ